MTTPEDHLKRVRKLSQGFDLLFTAIKSSSYQKTTLSLKNRLFNSSKNMSNILDEYDKEVHGEEEKGFWARLFRRKQDKPKQWSARMQSFRFSTVVEPKLFEDQEKESYHEMFQQIDTKKDYTITKDQFESYLLSLGFGDPVGLDFACNAFQLLDLDGSGDIDLDEFIAFAKISKQLPRIRRPIIKFFDFVDVDGSESIEISELNSALSYLALPPLREEDQKRLSKLSNADGELEFEVRYSLALHCVLRIFKFDM